MIIFLITRIIKQNILIMAHIEKIHRSGQYIVSQTSGESVRSFIPDALPPSPDIDYTKLIGILEKASAALGRLDGLSDVLPDMHLFLYFYIRKEAVLSSQIEGTQSSLSDLLLFEVDEAPGVPVDDVEEVSSYVSAMKHGLKRLEEGFPLSLRLIREMHKKLLSNSRGKEKQPGEFRVSQNWIGGTRPGNAVYVPPPPDQVIALMGQLEKFIHADHNNMPMLVKIGLIHMQFETIHPFLDGNGRLGRLLITLYLCEKRVLSGPLLYLSLYLKSHRNKYYNLLQKVRNEGAWEEWLEFFLTGIFEISEQATKAASTVLNIFKEDAAKIESLGRPAASAMRVHQYAQANPILKIPKASIELGISQPTVTTAIKHLCKLGILTEISKKQRNRTYMYHEYLGVLSEGTKPGK